MDENGGGPGAPQGAIKLPKGRYNRPERKRHNPITVLTPAIVLDC
jgi:hypothetical protein